MWLEFCVVVLVIIHIFICPYTKVEESFNMQAVHDIINYGTDINKVRNLVGLTVIKTHELDLDLHLDVGL